MVLLCYNYDVDGVATLLKLLFWWLNTSLLAVLLLHYCVLGVIVATMVVGFSQVVKLSGGIDSTIVVDPVVDSSIATMLVLLQYSSNTSKVYKWWYCYHNSGGPQSDLQRRLSPRSDRDAGKEGARDTRDTARNGCCEFWKFHPGPLGCDPPSTDLQF